VETATETVTSTAIVQSDFVHIYFCTTNTCAKEATQAQINAVSRRASESPLVEKVVFISKEETLADLRRQYPEEVKALPSNPFPDRLTVVPKHPEDLGQVAALFSADPAHGIDRINYGR
jgi:cell division protein FtsX